LENEDENLPTWERFGGYITLRKLLPQKIEFGKKVLDQGIHEENMFMKKNKLACGIIYS
jgi:hypothetical protein